MAAVSPAALALGGRDLERLRAEARSDPRAAARAAARQFEALFLQQVLEQMRKALPGTDLLASDATRLQTSLLDQQLAVRLAERGTGLAEAIARQLERALPRGEAPSAAPPSAASPAPPPPAGPADTRKEAFLERMAGPARQAARALGVPAEYVLGQAALESGWGRREIRGPDGAASHNLFGIKAGAGWRGPTVEASTLEVVDGVARRVVERFRAYGSYAEAFADYAGLLSRSPRYASRVPGAADARAFAHGLQAGGYATDPEYARKLEGVIASVTRLAGAARA